jgi:hypothetical protein
MLKNSPGRRKLSGMMIGGHIVRVKRNSGVRIKVLGSGDERDFTVTEEQFVTSWNLLNKRVEAEVDGSRLVSIREA